MKALDLISFKGAVDEEVMAEGLRDHDLELHFNGRLVWGDIVAAIVAARRDLASATGVDENYITPRRLDVAVYHPEEQAMYVSMEFAMPAAGPGGLPQARGAGQVLRRGEALGEAKMETASVGTCSKILELMDAIDLKRVIWLPYTGPS